MRKNVTRVAAGVLLIFIALVPLGPASGQPFSLPQECKDRAFSTEEDFLSQGPEPPDGNPIISDGDLLSRAQDPAGNIYCLLCARNADLLSIFQVGVDLGLDAVDVLEAGDAYLVAFSTELNSPNNTPEVIQFTEGDLLMTNGVVIPNTVLTAHWFVGRPAYDLGLDAVHFVGEQADLDWFVDAASQYTRDDWLKDPQLLEELLGEVQVDIWYSTEGTLGPVEEPAFLDGDLLSARDGVIVAHNFELLDPGVPAGVPERGVDFGLDGATTDRAGGKEQIFFSTELLFDGDVSFTDGDVLLYGNGVVRTNRDLFWCFEPKAEFLGLDALHLGQESPPSHWIYLPIVFRNYE